MKTLTILLFGVITFLGCNPNTFTSDSGDAHATKIIVTLAGKYATDDIVDVTIGSGGATSIGKDQPSPEAYATVEPGTYTIIGIAHGVGTGQFTHSTTVEAGQQKRIVFNLNDATLTVRPDALWIGTHNNFRVKVYTETGPVEMTVGAGQSNAISFRPGKSGNQVDISDADTGQILDITVVKIFYSGTLTLNLPFK